MPKILVTIALAIPICVFLYFVYNSIGLNSESRGYVLFGGIIYSIITLAVTLSIALLIKIIFPSQNK
jgi:hypothetical protein